MLADFDEAFTRFQKDAYSRLHEVLFDAGTNRIALNWQINAQALAGDLGYFAMILRDLHVSAIAKVSERFDAERDRPTGQRERILEITKYGVALKSFLFFVRAYQDSIYRVGLLIDGKAASPGSSMMNIAENREYKSGNPVAAILSVETPDYLAWFLQMRHIRDRIKDGIGYGEQTGKNFMTGETTVAIQIRLANTDDWPSIGLSDVTKALNQSGAATRAILTQGVKSGRLRGSPGGA